MAAIEDFLADAKRRMDKSIEATHHEFNSIRTGRASPALLEDDLARFIAEKGSIAIDGVSLTVNEVKGSSFGVNIIPYTLAHTSLGEAQHGRRMNLEIDPLARYVARWLGMRGGNPEQTSK